MVPKRADEIMGAGSLYWVIRGQVMCRQRVIAVRPFVDKEASAAAAVLEPKVTPVEPRPWRAFQGWRYLADKDAPRDLDAHRAGPARDARRHAARAAGAGAAVGASCFT